MLHYKLSSSSSSVSPPQDPCVSLMHPYIFLILKILLPVTFGKVYPNFIYSLRPCINNNIV